MITGNLYSCLHLPWWRQMETFSVLLAICAGNSPVPGEFPTQRPVTRSFDVFFDLRLNKRLSKQSWGWWFETLSRPLLHHRNAIGSKAVIITNFLFQWTSIPLKIYFPHSDCRYMSRPCNHYFPSPIDRNLQLPADRRLLKFAIETHTDCRPPSQYKDRLSSYGDFH